MSHNNTPHSPDHLHPTVRAYVQNPRIAETYDEDFANNQLFSTDCAFLSECLPASGLALDLGCGTGRHMLHLHQLGWRSIGVDLSPHFLRCARSKLLSAGAPARLVQADIHALPFAPHPKFDAALLLFSLLGLIHSHEQRIRFLRSLHPMMNPGALALIHVHNREFAPSALMRQLNKLPPSLRKRFAADRPGDKVMHNYRGIQDLYLHSFSRDELRSLLDDSHWVIEALLPLNARRDGILSMDASNAEANGFLILARSESSLQS